jgi:hypothetical protein
VDGTIYQSDSKILMPVGQPDVLLAGNNNGPCDIGPFLKTPSILLPFRSARFALTFAKTGADLRLNASSSERLLWADGVGDSSADAGLSAVGDGKLHKSDTDAFAEGALADAGQTYKVWGLAARPERPFTLTGTVKTYPAWVDSYLQRLIDVLMYEVTIFAKHGNSNCDWNLGVLGDWSQMSGSTGGLLQTIGTPLAGAYNQFRVAEISGSRDETDKMKVQLKTDYDLLIANDPAAPVQSDVLVPFKLQLIGTPCCRQQTANACPVPGQDQLQAQINAVANSVAGMQSQFAQLMSAISRGLPTGK